MSAKITLPLDIPQIQVLYTEISDDFDFIIHIDTTKNIMVCPRCKRTITKFQKNEDSIKQKYKMVFGRMIYLEYYPKSFYCTNCNQSIIENLLQERWFLDWLQNTIENANHSLKRFLPIKRWGIGTFLRKNPKISIITATHNNEAYLPAAMDSILKQSFPDFEFLIVNDGCTDGSKSLLAEYSQRDSRIIIINNETRLGRAAARNKALKVAKGDLIAIFDSDDISHPKRLETQYKYLKGHSDIDYCGTGCFQIDKASNKYLSGLEFIPPISHGSIIWSLFFNFPFHHSSTMGKREIFLNVGGYDDSLPVCEDCIKRCNPHSKTA